MELHKIERCTKCGKWMGKENKCNCDEKTKQKSAFERVNEMPVTSDEGCRELLAALVKTACDDYVQDILKGNEPNKEDVSFIPDGIKEQLEVYIAKFMPLIRQEEKKKQYGTWYTRCPACGGKVTVHRTFKLFRVSCNSCVCKCYKVYK